MNESNFIFDYLIIHCVQSAGRTIIVYLFSENLEAPARSTDCLYISSVISCGFADCPSLIGFQPAVKLKVLRVAKLPVSI